MSGAPAPDRRAFRDLVAAAREAHAGGRAQHALLGAAIAYSGARGRGAIRRIARRSSVFLPYYQRIWDDASRWQPFAIEGEERLSQALSAGKGAIVSPSHFGRYRWIAGALLSLGHKISILVDAPTMPHVSAAAAEPVWQSRFPRLDHDYVETVNSGAPTALWQLTRALRGGRVVLMFVDGNSGIHGRTRDARSLTLPFLGCTVYARTGIGALSAFTGAPIVRCRTRDPDHGPPLLAFEAPISAEAGEPKDAFRERATRALFASLEQEIEAQPDRWEEWATFPDWVLSRPAPQRGPIVPAPLGLPATAGRRLALASPTWWPLRLSGAAELLDVATGQRLPANDMLVSLAHAAERGDDAAAWVSAAPRRGEAFDALVSAMSEGVVTLTSRKAGIER